MKDKIENAKSIAIIGSSFIGSESASSIKGKFKDEKEVHLIDMVAYPLVNVLGQDIGKMVANEHTTNGVKLHMNSGVKAIKGTKDGKVEGVQLSDGSIVKADLVLVGIGVMPATSILKGSKVQLD